MVEALAAEPRPRGARQLKGTAAWRVRVGEHRVTYEVHDDELLVLVLKVGHRKDVYRQR